MVVLRWQRAKARFYTAVGPRTFDNALYDLSEATDPGSVGAGKLQDPAAMQPPGVSFLDGSEGDYEA